MELPSQSGKYIEKEADPEKKPEEEKIFHSGTSVEWRTDLPPKREFRESPVFTLCGAECRIKLFQVRKRLSADDELTVSFTRLSRADFSRELRSVTCIVLAGESRVRRRTFHFAKCKPSRVITASMRLYLPGQDVTLLFSFRFEDASGDSDSNASLSSVCLRSLSNDLQKLAAIGTCSDLAIRCSDRCVRVHRAILSARSEVFEAMLHSDMLETRTGYVDMTDMGFPVLELFLRFVYTGTLPDELPADVAVELYEAGDKYAVSGLKTQCAGVLKEQLTEETACDMLVMADAHSDPGFKEFVVNYIVNREIPDKHEEWPKFCVSHPELCLEVLRRYAMTA